MIKQIKQSVDPEEVNEYLSKGFRIVKIISSKIKTEQIEEIKPCYILAVGDDVK